MSDTTAENQVAVNNGRDSAYSSPSFVSPQGDIAWGSPGLTKRELLAAMAMQGLSHPFTTFDNVHEDRVARFAVRLADALLAELAK